ncbi:MAG: S8 family serine peptidase, partial [Bacteroidota bacterium]
MNMQSRNLFDWNIWLLLLVPLLLHHGSLDSQTKKYWIFLKDKGPPASVVTTKYDSPNVEDLAFLGLTERAIKRRSKMHPGDGLIDIADLPLHPPYLVALRAMGIRVLRTSKWLNAVSVELSDDQFDTVSQLPFVQHLKPVAKFLRRRPSEKKLPPQPPSLEGSAHVFDYGPSLTQLELIRIPDLHDMNITGGGVLVGMLDTGFRWRDHEALMNLNVIAEYDFINEDSVTADEPQEGISQDGHGTATLSLVGAFKEGQLIGGAFGADFLLGKTEVAPTERKIEEDYWVAGIEWMEGQGVDVVNSSLGYFDFDPSGEGGPDYTFADLDGQTAVTTRAANIAASKGVVVVVSAGNNNLNSYWPWINTPADATGALAIGAVSAGGSIASFSSRGPTADGRTKPDVVAMGVGTRVTSFFKDSSTYNFFTGTSASAPLAASAAALLLSARSELTPPQVFDALRNTADRAEFPDNTFGWGLINATDALQYPTLRVQNLVNIVEIFLTSANGIADGSPTLFHADEDQPMFTALPMTLRSPSQNTTRGVYTASVPPRVESRVILFFIQASDSVNGVFTIPPDAPASTFSFVDGEGVLFPTHVKPVLIPSAFQLFQNFPNPFNQGTIIQYDL